MLERLAKAGRVRRTGRARTAGRTRRSTFDTSMAKLVGDEWRPVGRARAWAREGEREGGTLNQRAQREGDRGVGESVARERRVRRTFGIETKDRSVTRDGEIGTRPVGAGALREEVRAGAGGTGRVTHSGRGRAHRRRTVARMIEGGALTGIDIAPTHRDARHRPAARRWGAEPKRKVCGGPRIAHGGRGGGHPQSHWSRTGCVCGALHTRVCSCITALPVRN